MIKIAIVAPYPAAAVLPAECIKPRQLQASRQQHPAPWVHALCRELSARGDIELRLFAHSRVISRVQRVEREGIRFTFIPKYEPGRVDPYLLHLPALLQILPLIKRFNPDVVHGFGTESAYGLLAVSQPQPAVVFIQGIQELLAPLYDMPRFKIALRRRLERHVVRRADALIAETGFAERWAYSVNPAARIRVIPHAFSGEFFNANPMFQNRRAICIGALSRVKGCDTVLQAFASVAQQQHGLSSETELHFIGSGPLEQELQTQARKLGLGKQVIFRGRIPHGQLISELEQANLLLIGSRMDTSPNVITEAHAAGIPVVGTRAGGIPDMIAEGQDGYLVDVDDVAAMAFHLNQLLEDSELCRRLGQAGRDKVRALNDPARIAAEHVALYHEVLGSSAGD
ncbi:MAG: glycosyltransferase family 4 protein [Candidatus Delongbacteria bacterium]|nr:glycosyltransferase family 4 protein [bacterium]MBL7032913.1 glycosyltransferase family 4 protein [Candidatus Delongbacteria bacterium]